MIFVFLMLSFLGFTPRLAGVFFQGALLMRLCTLLWLIRGNAFFWYILGEAELLLGYVTLLLL